VHSRAGLKSAGAIIGIIVGCTLGMFPLLFTKHKEGDHQHPDEIEKAPNPQA
jgi:Transmembrane protein 65